ncbi:MAG: hypothetical protein ACKVVP_01515 [Chloroflexota bacterium]
MMTGILGRAGHKTAALRGAAASQEHAPVMSRLRNDASEDFRAHCCRPHEWRLSPNTVRPTVTYL